MVRSTEGRAAREIKRGGQSVVHLASVFRWLCRRKKQRSCEERVRCMPVPTDVEKAGAQKQLERVTERGVLEPKQLQLLWILIEAWQKDSTLDNTSAARELHEAENPTPKQINATKTQLWELRKRLKEHNENQGRLDPTLIEVRGGFAIEIAPNRASKADDTKAAAVKTEPDLNATSTGRPAAAHSWKRILLTAGGLLLAGIAISLSMAVKIVRPPDGKVSASQDFEGRGGRPWQYHYLVVEPVSLPGVGFVQNHGPIEMDYLLRWTRSAHIGDSTTPSGTKFYIYVLSTSTKLQESVDFDASNGQMLKPILPVDRPSHTIQVTLER